MPRKVTINESPNPTGLNMHERQLCIEFMQSMEESVTRLRNNAQANNYWRRSEWTAEDERRIRNQAYRSAYNQLSGRQKTEKGHFTLRTQGGPPDQDMAYVMESLGITL